MEKRLESASPRFAPAGTAAELVADGRCLPAIRLDDGTFLLAPQADWGWNHAVPGRLFVKGEPPREVEFVVRGIEAGWLQMELAEENRDAEAKPDRGREPCAETPGGRGRPFRWFALLVSLAVLALLASLVGLAWGGW